MILLSHGDFAFDFAAPRWKNPLKRKGGDISMHERVIVFGAHPDDGEIGAGGTIAAYAERGHRIVMVVLPNGPGENCPKGLERRRGEADRAARVLGAEVITLGLGRDAIRPDARLVGAIDRMLGRGEPTGLNINVFVR